MLPALSVLQYCSTWSPSVLNSTDVPVWLAPPSTLYCVLATPDNASEALNVTVRLVLFQAGGAVADVTGGVRSMRTAGADDAVVELPALSATFAVTVRFEPSLLMVLFGGHALVVKPDSASVHVHLIETSDLYQSFAFAEVVGAPVSVGAVRSMLMGLTVVDVVLPAASMAVPATDWFAPSAETVALGPHDVTAFKSEHVKLTATWAVLFQPFAFATGTRLALMTGAMLSRVKDALSVTVVPLPVHVELPL